MCFSLFLLLLLFNLFDSQPIPNQPWREELNNLQANVEFLTNRINNADANAARPVETYNYESTNNDVIDTNRDPIISSTHSSPQNSNNNANLTLPERTLDASANYANNTDTSKLHDTPSKSLIRSSSIKYVNDADDEPVYYNEPSIPSYTEQPAYFEQPGKMSWNKL